MRGEHSSAEHEIPTGGLGIGSARTVQGTTPRALVSLVVLRTVAMCAIGSVTGIAVGVGLGWFVASSVGVGGEGAVAVPPLVFVAPWGLVVILAVALLAVIGVAVYLLTRRHFARESLGAGIR